MSEIEFEDRLRALANGLEYPRTPDIAGFVTMRLRTATRARFNSKALAWSLTIVLVLLSSLMLIPSARAAIIDIIQIGIVRIFPSQPTPTPWPVEATPTAKLQLPASASPTSTSVPLIPMLKRIAGKTTLEDAQRKVDYPILLPTYPADLGNPDAVFVQNLNGEMTVLVWFDPQQPKNILMSLHMIPSGSWAVGKMEPEVIQETNVNDQRAIWAVGPYPLILSNGDTQFMRMIDGHVLIWADGDVTYRLETDLSLEEALQIAESLEPIP